MLRHSGGARHIWTSLGTGYARMHMQGSKPVPDGEHACTLLRPRILTVVRAVATVVVICKVHSTLLNLLLNSQHSSLLSRTR